MKAAFPIALAVGFVLVQAARADDDAVKKDLAAMQGEWVVAGAEQGGKKLSEEDRRKLSDWFLSKMVIKDDQVTYWIGEKGGEAKEGQPTAFEIDPTKKPKTIRQGQNILGIYSIEGDTLKICVHGDFSKERQPEDRPTSFDTSKNENAYLFIFKRKK